MISKLLQIVTGLLLSGCAVNNFSSTALTNVGTNNATELVTSAYVLHEQIEAPLQSMMGNLRINPECNVYVPLTVPKPVQINFKELESAESGKEINAIALRNVKELHQQLYSYAAKQKVHYGEYVKRCVVK